LYNRFDNYFYGSVKKFSTIWHFINILRQLLKTEVSQKISGNIIFDVRVAPHKKE